MRRWLALLILVLLPLQLTWAATSSYCRHEGGLNAQHVGHHSHQHNSASADGANTANAAAADADCGTCHAGCTLALAGSHTGAGLHASRVRMADHLLARSSPPLDIPDRPQWPTLA